MTELDLENFKSGNIISEYNAKKILKKYGVPVVNETIATSIDEAVQAAEEIGHPIVAKGLSPQITHKTDANIIRLSIQDENELKKKYDEIISNIKSYDSSAEIEGVLIQEMIENGREVIMGAKKDEVFGPMIMFGIGGIFTEILEDLSFRIAPLSEKDAEKMVREIKGYPLLKGARGGRKSDINSIIETLCKVSDFCLDNEEEIEEIDVNPFIVLPEGEGGKVVDALIKLSD